jgi:hypothetical protein
MSYSLHLTFDKNKPASTVYTCGDVLKGSVHLGVIQPISTTSITIHLKCEARTILERSNGQTSHSYQSTAVVYDTAKQLVNEPSTFFNDSDLSFEFKLPTLAQQVVASPWSPSKTFEHTPGHSLPPSWVSGDKSQCIEHFLEVVMQRPSIDIDAIHRFPITFSPSRNVLLPHTEPISKQQFISRQSHLLGPVSHSKRPGMPRRVLSLFGAKGSELVAGFNLSNTLPTVIYVGGPLPITLSLVHDPVRSTAPEIPPVYITNLFARVTAFTDVRVGYHSLMGSGEYHHDFRGKITLCWLPHIKVLMSEDMNLHEFLPALRIGQKLCPSFKTYNVKRSYVLKVSIPSSTLFGNLL